jgi:hypothetical protein
MKFGYNIRKLEMKLTTLLGRLNITILSLILRLHENFQGIKTWSLVNDLNSRKVSDVTSVKKVNLDGYEITNAAEISDAFNSYFTSIGEKLANKIPL